MTPSELNAEIKIAERICDELYSVTAHLERLFTEFSAADQLHNATLMLMQLEQATKWHEQAVKRYALLIHRRKAISMEN